MVLINAFTFAMVWCLHSQWHLLCYFCSIYFPDIDIHQPQSLLCTLVVEKTLFSVSAGALNSGQACSLWATTLGFLEKFGCSALVTGLCIAQFTAQAKLNTGIISDACHKDSLKTAVCRLPLELWVPCGNWRNSWLRGRNTDLTHLKHVLPTYMSASSIEINSTIHKSRN